MRIKFLSTNAEQEVPNWYGKAEIAAGRAEEVKKPTIGQLQPVWSVEVAHGFVRIVMKLGTMGAGAPGGAATPRIVQTYSGDPDLIHDRKDSNGRKFCSAFGRPVPDEILKEYRKAWKNPQARKPEGPKVTDDYNKVMAADLARRQTRPFVPVSETEALDAHEAVGKDKGIMVPPPGRAPYEIGD
jgi:hypothetical protein